MNDELYIDPGNTKANSAGQTGEKSGTSRSIYSRGPKSG